MKNSHNKEHRPKKSRVARDKLIQHVEKIRPWQQAKLDLTRLAAANEISDHGQKMLRSKSSHGLRVLLTGSSGAGKSMVAEFIASKLGLPLYRIDLGALVSEYIGETEKNLAQLLESRALAQAVLFFDEADALFGKRTRVADAHDRFANSESTYLLQQLQAYAGVIILATNREPRIDQDGLPKLDLVIDWPPKPS